MSLDMERQRNNRFDIVCCVKGKKGDSKPVEGVLYRLESKFYNSMKSSPGCSSTSMHLFCSQSGFVRVLWSSSLAPLVPPLRVFRKLELDLTKNCQCQKIPLSSSSLSIWRWGLLHKRVQWFPQGFPIGRSSSLLCGEQHSRPDGLFQTEGAELSLLQHREL